MLGVCWVQNGEEAHPLAGPSLQGGRREAAGIAAAGGSSARGRNGHPALPSSSVSEPRRKGPLNTFIPKRKLVFATSASAGAALGKLLPSRSHASDMQNIQAV